MALEEKRAWIMLVVAIAAYAVYVIRVLGQGTAHLADVDYVPTLLWTVGAAILAGIVLHIIASIASGESTKDERDREIERFGEHVGQSFLVIGAVAALILAMAEAEHFWIANVIYLAFVLSAVLGSITRIFAYRKGFQTW